MAYSPDNAPLLLWLTPALLALLLYGLGQGFVKMWITEVPPARFCLYFACARAGHVLLLPGQSAHPSVRGRGPSRAPYRRARLSARRHGMDLVLPVDHCRSHHDRRGAV